MTNDDFDLGDSVLWSYLLKTGEKPADFDCTLGALSKVEQGFYWVHLQADSPNAMQTLTKMQLPESVVEGLCATETRPRAIQFEQGMLIYLRGINRNPNADPEDMVSLRIWLTPNYIVTARRKDRKLQSVLDVKSALDDGFVPEGTADLMLLLIDKIADRISETVDELDEQLTEFEALERSDSDERLKLSIIRRKSAAIRRYLAPQRDALDAIYRFNKALSNDQAYELRDLSDRMTRYVEELDLAKERAMVLQDELRNRIAEQQGMRMYVLSLVTAIFLPLSFLTGVFGMNVAGLPGLEEPNAFNILATSMGGLAFCLLVFMAWKKWF